MNKFHKFFVGILVFALIASVSTISNAIAIAESATVDNEIALKSTVNNKAASDLTDIISTQTLIDAPTVKWDNTQYNMIVRYTWRVGRGRDNLAMSNDWLNYDLMNDIIYQTDEFPEYAGTNHCAPDYFMGKSFNSSSKAYSSSYTSLEHDVDMGEYTLVRYGYESRYSAVGKFEYGASSFESTIPTSYDQEHYIWNHHSNTGHKIKGTISYQGQLADIEVTIPWIGYKTSSVVIKGETFYLRTGPNKCSIKAQSSNLHVYDLNFAFGIE